ncbi:MAG: transporter [Natronomonas sp.]
MVVDSTMYLLHGLFAALWTGSVLFVAIAVLPAAGDGAFGPDAFRMIVGRLRWITRTSALVTLLTGGHMAGTFYTVDSLTGTGRGHLVLTMVALWLLLAAVVEIGSARAARSLDRGKKREPARLAKPFYYVGAASSIGLLVVAGVLGLARFGGGV